MARRSRRSHNSLRVMCEICCLRANLFIFIPLHAVSMISSSLDKCQRQGQIQTQNHFLIQLELRVVLLGINLQFPVNSFVFFPIAYVHLKAEALALIVSYKLSQQKFPI